MSITSDGPGRNFESYRISYEYEKHLHCPRNRYLVVLVGCSTPLGSDTGTRSRPSTTTPNGLTDDCQSPNAAISEPKIDTPAEAQSQNSDISVVGGSLNFDPNRVWQRVQLLLGVDVSPPEKSFCDIRNRIEPLHIPLLSDREPSTVHSILDRTESLFEGFGTVIRATSLPERLS